MNRRLILVGGSAGSGKSTAARALASLLSASWLQLDTLWIAIRDAAPPDRDERGILGIDERVRAQDEPAESLLTHQIAASELVCSALPNALAFELQVHPIVVADGAWLLPAFVAGLELTGVDVVPVFLYEADEHELARAMSSRRARAMVAPWHADSTRLAWLYGNWLADQAEAVGLPVEASRPYGTLADRLLARISPAGG